MVLNTSPNLVSNQNKKTTNANNLFGVPPKQENKTVNKPVTNTNTSQKTNLFGNSTNINNTSQKTNLFGNTSNSNNTAQKNNLFGKFTN